MIERVKLREIDRDTDKEKQQNKERRQRGVEERQRNKVREHQEEPSHLASANTLLCHCEGELVHSSDSLKRCQGGGRARDGGRRQAQWDGGGRREG